MSGKTHFSIAVLPGDGIGPEVIAPTLALLDEVVRRENAVGLSYTTLESGAGLYQRTGVALPEESVAACKEADAILLGAMGLPGVRYPDGTEIVPQIDLRNILELYAGVRPVRTIPGVPAPLGDGRSSDIDFVLVRENTEGIFAGRRETDETAERARAVIEVTRKGSERLFHFAFRLARQRANEGKAGRLTLIDKANVLGTMAYFRKIFDAVAGDYPDIAVERTYVDAMAMNLVKRPWDYDVMVTENMFGDILSDLGAALMGGLGFAPSADIGAEDAVFQPCHGTAPDIMGQGKANPTATILSGAMMLDWLGKEHACDAAVAAGARLTKAVDAAFADGALLPFELGGKAGTQAIAEAVSAQL